MGLNLGLARDMTVAEFLALSDAAWKAAFAEVRANASVGTAVPQAITNHYARKNLVAVAFVTLEDRLERGTLRGSRDGSVKRAFNLRTEWLTRQPVSAAPFVLAGIQRHRCRWVNQTFPGSRFGHLVFDEVLEGDFTEDERALWTSMHKIADVTNIIVDRKRNSVPTSRKLLLNRSEVA